MSGLKQVVRNAFDVIEDILPKAMRGLGEQSRRQAKEVHEILERIRAKDAELAASQRTPDANVSRPDRHDATPNGNGPVRTGDVDSYAGLRSRARRGDGLEHDHVPSAASLIRAAREKSLRETGEDLSAAQIRDIYNNAGSIELPASVHRATRTYGGRNTQAQIAEDAADLAAAANRDYGDRIALLLEAGFSVSDIEDMIGKLMAFNRGRGIH